MIPEAIDTDVIQLITIQQAWHYMVLPTSKSGDILNLSIVISFEHKPCRMQNKPKTFMPTKNDFLISKR